MDAEIEPLMIDVRASTSGFRADIEAMRGTLDTSLIEGFSRAGTVLERGLVSAIRRGNLGFDDLKRTALQTMNTIATNSLRSGIASAVPHGGGGGGIASLLSGAAGALLGLPGRATGGPVSPGRAYVVGERGPEMFVPTSSGRVETNASRQRSDRDIRVSINLPMPRGADAPVALRRSSKQVASAVSRAMRNV